MSLGSCVTPVVDQREVHAVRGTAHVCGPGVGRARQRAGQHTSPGRAMVDGAAMSDGLRASALSSPKIPVRRYAST